MASCVLDHRGALVTIRRSKTDQEGLGRKVGIPRGDIACPVTALEAWLEAAGIGEGAVFRRVFNRRAQRVGDQRLAARNVASVVKLPPPAWLRPCDLWRAQLAVRR